MMLWMMFLLLLIGCIGNDTVEPEYGPEIRVSFTPDNEQFLVGLINTSEHYLCAFYDLESVVLIDVLRSREGKLYLDDKNYENNIGMYQDLESKIQIDRSRVMHNKFCVINGSAIVTGSYNPTDRGTNINSNNMVLIHSPTIARSYTDYFRNLESGQKGGHGADVLYNDHLIESWFCPGCDPSIYTDLIDGAEHSLRFMFFSFTHDDISESLIKAKNRGISVSGVMESSQFNKYAEYNRLAEDGIEVVVDRTGSNMHHKVLIIDEEIVLTGSANPSKNGLTNNDENILVIHDGVVARQFISEFNRLWDSLSVE